MKRTLTLFVALVISCIAFAQKQGPMSFAGASSFSGVFMGMEASQENPCDTVVFELKSTTTGDITMPAVTFNTMKLTIPSFTVHGATFDFDYTTLSATFHAEQAIHETIVVNDAEKTISGTLHEAAYNHDDNSFSLRLTYTYGNMPGSITYVFKGEFITPDGIGHVMADKAEDETFNLYGLRTAGHSHGIFIQNGRKIIR